MLLFNYIQPSESPVSVERERERFLLKFRRTFAFRRRKQPTFLPNYTPFLPNDASFLPNYTPFLPNDEPFLPNDAPFLPNYAPFLPNDATFLPNDSSFLPNDAPFLPNYAPFRRKLLSAWQYFIYKYLLINCLTKKTEIMLKYLQKVKDRLTGLKAGITSNAAA
jgi:hypothetical protein